MKKRCLTLSPKSAPALSLSLFLSQSAELSRASPSPPACIASTPSALPRRSSIALPLPVSLSVLRHKMMSGDEGMEGSLLQGVDCTTAADSPESHCLHILQKGSKEIVVRILKINCNLMIKSWKYYHPFHIRCRFHMLCFCGIICQFFCVAKYFFVLPFCLYALIC